MRCGRLWIALLALGAARVFAQDLADPDAALRLAREFRAARQPELEKLFAPKKSAARAEAVRKFLAETKPTDPNPVALDDAAAVCSDSARLMLLDQIPARLAPADALAISRAAAKSGPIEERVVALRNISRLAPGERPAVAARLRAILRDPALEGTFASGQAFDGVVGLRDVEAIPILAGLLKDSKLAPLAGMTLDRLAEAAPAKVAAYLNAHFDALAAFPLLRADDFAKGSLADPAVRAEVEAYLARSELTDRELEKFFSSYLQPGEFLVAGIFTGMPDAADGPETDRAAELRTATAGWGKAPALRRAVAARDRVLARLNEDEPEER
jgi:hypothetical protein